MYIWIGLGIFATFLWAVTNHIDKYLVSKMFKGSGVGTLMIFSSLVTGAIMSPIFFIISNGKVGIDGISIVWLYWASAFCLLALYMYLKALEKDDASTVIAVFQTIPVFSYFLGLIFLNEVLTAKQIVACLVIMVAAVLITIDFSEKDKHKDKIKALIFMLISSFGYAMSFFLFKFVASNMSFYVTAFWEQIAFFVNGILMLVLIKKYRKEFIAVVRSNGKAILSLNMLNELLNSIAKVMYNYASMSIPLAILWALNGLQPFFVFLIGLVLTIILPNIVCEDINKMVIVKKVSCIVLSIIGLLLLYF
ncbi:MAG TPA: hypothetical protein DEP72_08430 [Clostridiales bacterium]|nr:MAG: hypothetical protein A2Y18_08115 [Clostridiales bacterium GWD2_32_19]HCC08163.1 hypothetical protein [Clostridiales bacterium]